MSSVEADFKELLSRIDRGREVSHASFEPIYYMIFNPKDILIVKRKIQETWKVKLEKEGWEVSCFSIAASIKQVWQEVVPTNRPAKATLTLNYGSCSNLQGSPRQRHVGLGVHDQRIDRALPGCGRSRQQTEKQHGYHED